MEFCLVLMKEMKILVYEINENSKEILLVFLEKKCHLDN
jgi:hypothetical protein